MRHGKHGVPGSSGLTPGIFITHAAMPHAAYCKLTSPTVFQIAWLMVVFPLFMFLSFQVILFACT